jgi:hypothetical protein
MIDERQQDDIPEPKVSAPATAAAGALAGATAGLVTGPFGPIAAGIGAIVGGLSGAAVGATVSQDSGASFTSEDETHYRALWEQSPERPADRGFEAARPAYLLGHVAAQQTEFVGLEFTEIEGELQQVWDADFRARNGEWSTVRRFARDAYGHARAAGFGVRRDISTIGTAGSAVDPVELAQARAEVERSVDSSERST